MDRVIILAVIFLTCSNAQRVLDSQLIGAPRIQCEESRIRLSIRTNEPFGGNVYAKGFFNKDICRVRGNGIGNSANITIPVAADCGMRRRRMVDPKGLVLEMTIVLMFHNKFLTRNDKAYHIECVYMELSQKVSNKLDISAIPSTQLSESVNIQSDMSSIPKCKYEVLDKDENGQTISFAAIGQPIYHRWSCQSSNAGGSTLTDEKLYCLTVHSCEVDDGQGSVQKLLDINGCPVDRALLDEVDYQSDLQAGRRGFVFKFADRPTVYFGCQLRLELKPEWKQQSLPYASTGTKSVAVPTSYGRGSPDESDTDSETKVTPDFPRPSPSVTPPTAAATIFTTTTTLATSATTIAVTSTPTKVTALLSAISNNAVVTMSKLQSPSEETYPYDFVEIPLSAPRQSANSNSEDVWQTVVASPRGRGSSKEVSPAPASKESQPASLADDNIDSVDPPVGGDAKYDGLDESAPGLYPEQLGTGEGTPEDETAEISNDSGVVQTDGAQQRARLRDDVTSGGTSTPVLKRRRTSRSTPTAQRPSHYDMPVDNDRQKVEESGGIRVKQLGLKQPQQFDNNEEQNIAGKSKNTIDSNVRSKSVLGQPRLGTFIDIDVTAPEVDVFDVPQIPVIHAGSDSYSISDNHILYNRAPEQVKLRDLSSQITSANQWCISHQVLSIALFSSSFMIIGVFISAAIAFQRIRHNSLRQNSYVEFTPQKRRIASTPDYLVNFSGEDSSGSTAAATAAAAAAAAARRLGLRSSAYGIHNGAHSSATIA